MRFLGWKEAKWLFQKPPLYNTFIKIPRIKHLKNTDLMQELPFYDKLSIVNLSKEFKRYARIYKIEIIDSKNPLAQLEARKLGIKDLFKDLSDEIKTIKF